jgi:cytochrome P450
MNTIFLTLQRLLNQRELLDPAQRYVSIDDLSPATLLVYDPALAHALLKSDAVIPADLLGSSLEVSRTPAGAVPTIESFFSQTPLLNHGEVHREMRKHLMLRYRHVQALMESWLDSYSVQYFDSLEAGSAIRADALVSGYVNGLLRQMLACELECSVSQLPAFPDNLIFEFLPRFRDLKIREAELHAAVQSLYQLLGERNRPMDDVWVLLTLVIMGHQPLLSALLYGLTRHDGPHRHGALSNDDAELFFRAVAPVDVISRQVEREVCLEGVNFVPGQVLYVSPHLLHLHSDSLGLPGPPERSMTFGMGPHACPGRKISVLVTQAFFNHLAQASHVLVDTAGIRWTRELMLIHKEMT